MHKVILIPIVIFSTLIADNTLGTQLQLLQKEEKLLTQQLAKVNRDIAVVKQKQKKHLKIKVTHKKIKQKFQKKHQHLIVYEYYYPSSSYAYRNHYNYTQNTPCNTSQHNHYNKDKSHHIRTSITRMQTSR